MKKYEKTQKYYDLQKHIFVNSNGDAIINHRKFFDLFDKSLSFGAKSCLFTLLLLEIDDLYEYQNHCHEHSKCTKEEYIEHFKEIYQAGYLKKN